MVDAAALLSAPSRERLSAGDFWEQHFDREYDRAAILAFVSEMRGLLLDDAAAAIPSALDTESFYRASVDLSWWIAGMAVLADWLGSNTNFYHYRADLEQPLSVTEYWEYAQQQAATALNASGVLTRSSDRMLGFTELFRASSSLHRCKTGPRWSRWHPGRKSTCWRT